MKFKILKKNVLLAIAGMSLIGTLSSCADKTPSENTKNINAILLTSLVSLNVISTSLLYKKISDSEYDRRKKEEDYENKEKHIKEYSDRIEQFLEKNFNINSCSVQKITKADDQNCVLSIDVKFLDDVTKGEIDGCIALQIDKFNYERISLKNFALNKQALSSTNIEKVCECCSQFAEVIRIYDFYKNKKEIKCISIYNKDQKKYIFKNEEFDKITYKENKSIEK